MYRGLYYLEVHNTDTTALRVLISHNSGTVITSITGIFEGGSIRIVCALQVFPSFDTTFSNVSIPLEKALWLKIYRRLETVLNEKTRTSMFVLENQYYRDSVFVFV